MSSRRTPNTATSISSVGSDRTGCTSTAAGSHTHSHSHRKHHHHRSRSAPRAPEKPPRKRYINPGHSLASIPSQIKLSMLNSGLISFGMCILIYKDKILYKEKFCIEKKICIQIICYKSVIPWNTFFMIFFFIYL